MALDKNDLTPMIGIPYEELNCWGVARQFYASYLGIELKHYTEIHDPDAETTRQLISTNVGDFICIDDCELKFGDLILIRMFGVESHIAVYIGDGKMLHTQKKTGSVIDRIERYENRITGFYRVKKGVRIC